MTTYEFTAIIADQTEITFDVSEAIYVAGCDDCSQWSRAGVVGMDCHREAADLPSAIRSVVADVQKAGYHVQEVRIDGDELARLTSGTNSPH